MIYDLHVHINPHAEEGKIYEYDTYAKMLHLDVVGFVTHYTPTMPEKLLRNFRDMISTFSIPALAGVEIYHPPKKLPKNFDYYLIHFSNVAIDADILGKYEDVIIAHPFAYGARISEEVLPILKKRNIGVEFNSSHYSEKHREFYKKSKEEGINITFGSDAHSPQEMGEGFENAKEFITPFKSLKVLRRNYYG